MEAILMAVIGAVVSYLVPKILDPFFKRSRQAPAEYRFPWPWWILSLTIGAGIGGALSAALGVQGLNSPGGLGNWAVFGACLGIAQWLVLQNEARLSAFWPLASALGWSVFAYFQAVKAPGPLGWIFAGLAVGLLQWPILRKRRRSAFWWVPANAIAWLFGGSMGLAAGLGMQQAGMSFASVWVLGWSLVGLFGSLITGFALSRMPLKQTVSPPDAPNPSPRGRHA